MRWEQLFADLESAFVESEREELAAEVADRSRAAAGRLRVTDRLRAAVGTSVQVDVLGHGPLVAAVESVGPDWLLLAEPGGRQALVPLTAIESVTGLGGRSAEPGSEGAVAARFGLAQALRGLARSRTHVTVTLRGGRALAGTLDRIGTDFVELAEHPRDEPRRADAVRAVRLLPFGQVALVRSV